MSRPDTTTLLLTTPCQHVLLITMNRPDNANAFNTLMAHELINVFESLALEYAERIAANAPIAVRQAKQSVYRGFQMSLSDGLAFEVEAYNRTVDTADRREGIAAFNEKRKPQFTGR